MPEDRRGLDHLMEQNETELDFLAAYGGVDDQGQTDGDAILAALERFLKAGGLACTSKARRLDFAFGTATATDDGCLFTAHGSFLPLVASDVQGVGFGRAQLSADRSEVEVCLTQWTSEQRRFIERLVEHHAVS
jgi:hypothetical protein